MTMLYYTVILLAIIERKLFSYRRKLKVTIL